MGFREPAHWRDEAAEVIAATLLANSGLSLTTPSSLIVKSAGCNASDLRDKRTARSTFGRSSFLNRPIVFSNGSRPLPSTALVLPARRPQLVPPWDSEVPPRDAAFRPVPGPDLQHKLARCFDLCVKPDPLPPTD